jgi:hypothetical protein
MVTKDGNILFLVTVTKTVTVTKMVTGGDR